MLAAETHVTSSASVVVSHVLHAYCPQRLALITHEHNHDAYRIGSMRIGLTSKRPHFCSETFYCDTWRARDACVVSDLTGPIRNTSSVWNFLEKMLTYVTLGYAITQLTGHTDFIQGRGLMYTGIRKNSGHVRSEEAIWGPTRGPTRLSEVTLRALVVDLKSREIVPHLDGLAGRVQHVVPVL